MKRSGSRFELRRFTTAPGIFFNEVRRPGIQFTERMIGWWSPSRREAPARLKRSDYEKAAQEGAGKGRRMEVLLTIAADDIEELLGDECHPASFMGTAEVVGLRPAAPDSPVSLLVSGGRLELFRRDERGIQKRRMNYEAPLVGEDDASWFLDGFKSISGGGPEGFDDPGERVRRGVTSPWRDLTSLFFTLRPSKGSGPVALGVLTLSWTDFLRQLRTIRATGGDGLLERFDTRLRFFTFFGAVLRDTYGRTFARGRYAPPDWHDRKRRVLTERGESTGAPLRVETERCTAADDSPLLLTRYRGRSDAGRPPIILAPGWGVRAASYALDTVRPSLVEYLCGLGYDVWLLDHRASPELAAIRAPFCLDHVAQYDWSCAVQTVLGRAGAKKVSVLAHCLSGASFMMSAVSGHVRTQIHAAILSQLAAHPVTSALNEFRIMLGLGRLMGLFGVENLPVTVDVRERIRPSLMNRLVKHYPTPDPCDNPVCRRIRFVFGESYLHANLDWGTHEQIIDMFGTPGSDLPATMSLRTMRHVARMSAAKRIVEEDGRDYLTAQNAANLDFPIALLGGDRNAVFLPAGLEASHRWLNARAPQTRAERLHISGYGHMDCFIGVRAAADVYPKITDWLAKHPE